MTLYVFPASVLVLIGSTDPLLVCSVHTLFGFSDHTVIDALFYPNRERYASECTDHILSPYHIHLLHPAFHLQVCILNTWYGHRIYR